MAALTDKQIDDMSKGDLAKACKARGIKHGKLSLLQQREALKKQKDEPAPKEKKAREKGDREPRGKMALAIDIFTKNKDKPRKEVLKLFQDKAKLTKAGSATYYALIQKRTKEAKS